jgi:hypothetical protein
MFGLKPLTSCVPVVPLNKNGFGKLKRGTPFVIEFT